MRQPSPSPTPVDDPALVEQILNDPAFTVRPVTEPAPAWMDDTVAGTIFANLARWNDGERHTERRAIVESLIGSLGPNHLAANARGASNLLLASGADAHAWIHGVSPYALGLTLGIAPDILPQMDRDVSAFARAIGADATDEQRKSGIIAAEELWATIEPLGRSEVVTANIIGLLFQGFDSMAALLGNALLHLRAHPGVTDVRTGIRRVIHESPPIRNTRRFAADNAPVDGKSYQAGASFILNLDGTRDGPTLAFGSGPHRCPGQVTAFTIAAAALDAGPRLAGTPTAGQTFLPVSNARIPDLRGVPLQGVTL